MAPRGGFNAMGGKISPHGGTVDGWWSSPVQVRGAIATIGAALTAPHHKRDDGGCELL